MEGTWIQRGNSNSGTMFMAGNRQTKMAHQFYCTSRQHGRQRAAAGEMTTDDTTTAATATYQTATNQVFGCGCHALQLLLLFHDAPSVADSIGFSSSFDICALPRTSFLLPAEDFFCDDEVVSDAAASPPAATAATAPFFSASFADASSIASWRLPGSCSMLNSLAASWLLNRLTFPTFPDLEFARAWTPWNSTLCRTLLHTLKVQESEKSENHRKNKNKYNE